ncbi:hypothetical protein DSM26151_25240 [Agromyces marinus]|uniref:Nucleotidyl transferase AbiEii toxin, Type IV TA system n=1 Tax=Agromyces marinus TaxID=1389020 RepID=A0ABM8H3E5_9MICO|nr:hypothetical protein [Agromyces marinus]UIP59612.1 hypothetical protein DSM26151_25240 [Agromyces marinus]BDZ55326.1 hypothetical protein GCM10025870_23990 [Agromyces marinus]
MSDDPPLIVLPPLAGAADESWAGILDLADEVPDGWCLIGGFMVLLHCLERGVVSTRPTDDGDAVVDVRARPTMLRDLTGALVRLGFAADGITADGHQHRWMRGAASIDVLLPDGIGERAGRATGVGGATTLQAPGTTQALDRSNLVRVQHGDRVGRIRRPDLLGALVAKAAAVSIPDGIRGQRHISDFCNLAPLVGARDLRGLTVKDRRRLRIMLAKTEEHPELVVAVDGAVEGLRRIALAIE